MNDRRDFGIVAHRQRIFADHVDVALIKLAETPFLRALAAVDPLDLVTTEGKRQLVLMLGHITGQRHGQIEAQGELRGAALLQCAGRLYEVHLPLGFPSGFGQ